MTAYVSRPYGVQASKMTMSAQFQACSFSGYAVLCLDKDYWGSISLWVLGLSV